MMSTKCFIEGGPDDMPTRIVPITPPGFEVKIERRAGYEHYKSTPRFTDTAEGRLPVYEWFERTEFAE
ncbi:DUF5988 family protein [Nocardia sp. NPDC004860]|uniref:DUF5988 family protein n=1 Tax=unclassified Nocardia TaxID=2637762 RepID=UPI0033A7AE23